jgi:hypothetical protein
MIVAVYLSALLQGNVYCSFKVCAITACKRSEKNVIVELPLSRLLQGTVPLKCLR